MGIHQPELDVALLTIIIQSSDVLNKVLWFLAASVIGDDAELSVGFSEIFRERDKDVLDVAFLEMMHGYVMDARREGQERRWGVSWTRHPDFLQLDQLREVIAICDARHNERAQPGKSQGRNRRRIEGCRLYMENLQRLLGTGRAPRNRPFDEALGSSAEVGVPQLS